MVAKEVEMPKRKVEKILERTRESLIKDVEEAKKRLAEFREKTRALARRAKEGAVKTAQISRLRLEIVPLTQKRDRKLKELGKKAYSLIKTGRISIKGLESLTEEIRDLGAKIRGKEKEIKKIKKAK